MKITKAKNINVVLIIAIFLVWIFIIALYLWNIRSDIDPFYLGRLTQLVTYPNTHFDPSLFKDLPLSYFLNLILVEFINFTPLQNAYLPIVQLIALFSSLALGKVISDSTESKFKPLFFIVPLVVFIRFFIFEIPYQEYFIGCALFLLFVWAFFKYNNQRNSQISITLILLFLVIHFFAVPMSAWILEFLVAFIILTYLNEFLTKRNIEKSKKIFIPITLLTLFTVIWVFWNFKFIHELQTGIFDLNTIYSIICDNLYAQSTSGFLQDAFMYQAVNTNIITKIAGILYLLLITVPIGLKVLYEMLRKNFFFFLKTKEDILMFSLLFPFVAEFLIYSSKGLFSLRYLNLIYPFISYFYILRFFNDYGLNYNDSLSLITKKLKVFKRQYNSIIRIYLILLIVTTGILVDLQLEQVTPALKENEIQSISGWYAYNIPLGSTLVTDFKTESYLKYFMARNNYNSSNIKRGLFTPDLYRYLAKEGNADSNFNYFLADMQDLNEPLLQGPPAWEKLVPLEYHIDSINSNERLNLIYDANFCRLYNNRG